MAVDRVCAELVRRLAASSEADLPRLAREDAAHLDACPSCTAELARRDPSALFALLAFERKDEAFFSGFETRVMAGVREARREERGGWLGTILRPRYLALAAATAAVAVVLIARQGPSGPPPSERAAAPPAAPGIPETGIAQAGPASGPEASSDVIPILERDAAAPSPVESVASATARVISIEVAGPQHEPSDLVLIVDPEMPL